MDAHRPERARAPQPWRKLSSEPGPDLIICRARFDRLVNPRTGKDLRRVVLETADWVNVVALTPAREVVMVRQFRFGTASVTLEIPGGVVDAGEAHRAAAERELREETGHTAARWSYLGAVEPNPAFHTNLCHHWLAEGAERAAAQSLDPGEDIAVELVPLADVRALVGSGAIRHSLVVCALARVLDFRRHNGA
jgi:8-oxo-dGTP pyrophosphatase MutT (NUDIX family)